MIACLHSLEKPLSRQNLDDILSAFSAGDTRALARLISLVEDEGPGHREVLDALLPRTGCGYRVGVTGPPGAGKSTLLEELILAYRKDGETVGVAAVDPSSPFTGGAFLGDRIRMARAAADSEVFIRSLGTRGSLGGLSARTEWVLDLMDAFGKQLLFVETVGVGQSELDIVENAYTTVVVLVPESGDGIQTLKAGLMEIGDLFVVNKADRGGAEALEAELRSSLELRPEADNWRPPVVACSALKSEGVEEVRKAIEDHRAHIGAEGRQETFRRRALIRRLRSEVERRVCGVLWGDSARAKALERGLAKLLAGELSFEETVDSLLPEGLESEDGA